MSETTGRSLIGWQGISVRVPADWTLGAVGGDKKAGYLRVDDEKMPRLQVKWSRGRMNLEQKRKEYVKRLTRRGRFRRRATGLEVTTDERVVSKRSKRKKELVGYGWRGPQCGIGVLWNCEVCGRALIAQVAWLLEEEGHETAREVLDSLDDHGTGGWETWGVDGLAFLAPEKYELSGWRRMTRYLEVSLARGAAQLKVARWGLVPMVLEGRPVKEWYEEEHRRRRDVRWDGERAEVKGHEGVRAWGERRRLGGGVRRMAARLVRREAIDRFEGYAWHCPESNRLYLVESVHGKGGEITRGVVDSVVCHEEE
ncbi:MAG: hypothetical protein JSV79_11615 [Armatimonadota bacterium]|nr:MAG: hypothetical protein JSV79_11615 [Armatimonadota bacterium]